LYFAIPRCQANRTFAKNPPVWHRFTFKLNPCLLAVLNSGFHEKAIFDKCTGVLIDIHVTYWCYSVHAKFAVELRIGIHRYEVW